MRTFFASLFVGIGLGLAASGLGLAADLPLKAPPIATAPPYNWSGWYAGLNAGYGWGASADPRTSLTDLAGVGFAGYVSLGGFPTASLNPKGGLGGFQIGYNFQQ